MKDEERNLPLVLPKIPRTSRIVELIAVDGRSRDGTVETAKRLFPNARIVLQKGSGKGDAILEGAKAAAGDWIVVLDADGSQDPSDILALVEKAAEGYDVVKGTRYAYGGSSNDSSWSHWLGTQVLQFLANRIWGTFYTDICYGMFLIRRETFLGLDMASQGHDIEWELMAKARMRGLRVAEVPVHELRRAYGKSHLRLADTGRILYRILSEGAARRTEGRRL